MELSFMDAYTLWCRAPYPSLGLTPALRGLRADLGEADEHASVVKAFVRTGRFRPSGADVLGELGDIVSQADTLCAESEGSDLEAAQEIRAYAALLAIVYQGFLREGGSG